MGLRPTMQVKVIGFVTPAQAGVHVPTNWIPAFAGMTWRLRERMGMLLCAGSAGRGYTRRPGRQVSKNLIPELDRVRLLANAGAQI
jgi:hypothetical protein